MTGKTTPLIGLSARTPAHDLIAFGHELDALQAFGIGSVELPIFDMDIVVGGRIRHDRLRALKAVCAGRDLVWSVHGPLAINLMDEDWRLPRHMQVLEAALEISAELEAVHYVIHGGIVAQQQAAGVEAAFARQRHHLARAGDIAARAGMHVCVETMFSGYDGQRLTASPGRLAAELAALDHPHVWATLDFSHAWLKMDYDGRRDAFVDEIRSLAPRARHLHLHDSFGRQDDIWMLGEGERVVYGHGDLHLPLGWGDIPWDAILAGSRFPEGTIFNLEMKPRYWHAVQASVDLARDMARRAHTTAGGLTFLA